VAPADTKRNHYGFPLAALIVASVAGAAPSLPRALSVWKIDRAFGEPENLRDRRASKYLFSKAVPAADIPLLLRRLRPRIPASLASLSRAVGSAVVAADPAMLFPPGRALYFGA